MQSLNEGTKMYSLGNIISKCCILSTY
uniref:Uncharacterized protein n=1 Tax=Rhizophora mucronata TaxID=61149 RepID=A0A2P2PCP8_RHIMU